MLCVLYLSKSSAQLPPYLNPDPLVIICDNMWFTYDFPVIYLGFLHFYLLVLSLILGIHLKDLGCTGDLRLHGSAAWRWCRLHGGASLRLSRGCPKGIGQRWIGTYGKVWKSEIRSKNCVVNDFLFFFGVARRESCGTFIGKPLKLMNKNNDCR